MKMKTVIYKTPKCSSSLLSKRRRITKSDRDKAAHMLKHPKLSDGHNRTVYICNQCGAVQSHDYIPFGMGHGIEWNPCHCHCVSSNWVFHSAITLAEIVRA